MVSVAAHGEKKQLVVFTSIRVRATGERSVWLLRLDVEALLRHVFLDDVCGGGGDMERSIGDEKKVKKDV